MQALPTGPLRGEKNGKGLGTKYNFVAISANQNQKNKLQFCSSRCKSESKKTQHTLKFSHLAPYF